LDRRKLLLASQLGMMLASIGLFVATASRATTPAIIYGLAALGGAASAFDAPARQSLLPRLAGVQARPDALSPYPAGSDIARLAGSLLLLPIFADQLLRVGPRGLGLLYAAQPIGAAVAGLLLSVLPTVRRQGRALLLAVAIYGAAIAVFGASAWFPLSLLALAVSGAADTISMVMRQTLRQMLTPDELRGRMTSVNMMFFIGGPQLGEVEAGVVAKLAGVRFSV